MLVSPELLEWAGLNYAMPPDSTPAALGRALTHTGAVACSSQARTSGSTEGLTTLSTRA